MCFDIIMFVDSVISVHSMICVYGITCVGSIVCIDYIIGVNIGMIAFANDSIYLLIYINLYFSFPLIQYNNFVFPLTLHTFSSRSPLVALYESLVSLVCLSVL